MSRFPPGPPGTWLLGSFVELQRDILGFIARLVRDYGDVVGFRVFGKPFCILGHPDFVEQVLVRDASRFVKSFDYHKLAWLVGQGLLTSEGEVWRRQRKLAQPIFHNDRIKEYVPIFVRRAARTAERWSAEGNIDVHADMMRLTLEIVTETLFHSAVDAEVPMISESLNVVARAFAGFPFPFWIPLPRHVRSRRCRRQLDSVIYRIIRERKAPGAASRESGDLLSLLLAARDDAGRPMTDRQLRDELMTVFLAGHETTAIALTFTIDQIAKHPDILARLHVEWDRVLGERDPTAADLQQLEYTRAVLQESMRLYPPAWFIGREPTSRYEIGGYEVPRGTTFFVCPFQLHRDGRFFPDPLRFDPERWRDESPAGAASAEVRDNGQPHAHPAETAAVSRVRRYPKPPRYAYFPFGAGPRSCIGAGFAMLEMTAALPVLLRRFEVSPVDPSDIPVLPAVTLRPARPVRMRVSERRITPAVPAQPGHARP